MDFIFYTMWQIRPTHRKKGTVVILNYYIDNLGSTVRIGILLYARLELDMEL